MKKTNRLFSGILALTIACTSAIGGIASASTYIPAPIDSLINNYEYYEKTRTVRNEKLMPCNELIDLYSKAFPMKSEHMNDIETLNLWKDPDSNLYVYVETLLPDSVGILINAPYIDAEEAELLVKEYVGDENVIDITNDTHDSPNVYVEFSSKDHEQNYEKCRKLKDAFAEKYDVIACNAYIDAHYFGEGLIYWHNLSENVFDDYTDEEAETLNAELEQEGLRVTYNAEGGYFDYSDDITYTELYEYAAYIKDKYNARVLSVYLTDVSPVKAIDLMAEEKINLAGDVNCDSKVNMSDVVAIMQFIADPDGYTLTVQGELNADVIGDDGVTNNDALAIQQYEAGIISALPIAE